ncbi:MAG: hypothetical protein A2161_10065 [Candidatus Schekmanbacteria bacterium RBG_13_48_7]|uniref:Uncharacterized protein n=1 Tax=Candidatus Schekmanbacteria bacterium RBG_13_48_7 TaxID=1817878 RepID=A0A1F7S146_9BACT|nr:MAG: hypothetical protein A2161_10065 [Candidatus Schekmanbacteria bacterium RBG_13_48_7]
MQFSIGNSESISQESEFSGQILIVTKHNSDKKSEDLILILDFPLSERINLAKNGSPDILSRLIFDKEEKVLGSIIENPNVTDKIILALCRRRVIPNSILEEISKNSRWLRNYQIKTALVSNPRTPVYISLRFVKTLYRQDLANLIRDVSVPASLRVNAEHVLKERIKDLTRGDKITLAHSATNPVLRILLMEGDLLVLQNALENSRLRENDILYLLNNAKVDDKILTTIASSNRWSNRYEIRLAVARHPAASSETLQNLLQNCLQQDLQEIIETTSLPLNARIEAKKVLKERISNLTQNEKLLLAQKGKNEVLNCMLYEDNEEIYIKLLKNPHLRDEHVVTISHKTSNPQTLATIARNEKWRMNKIIALALFYNTHSPAFIKTHLQDFIDQQTTE